MFLGRGGQKPSAPEIRASRALLPRPKGVRRSCRRGATRHPMVIQVQQVHRSSRRGQPPSSSRWGPKKCTMASKQRSCPRESCPQLFRRSRVLAPLGRSRSPFRGRFRSGPSSNGADSGILGRSRGTRRNSGLLNKLRHQFRARSGRSPAPRLLRKEGSSAWRMARR